MVTGAWLVQGITEKKHSLSAKAKRASTIFEKLVEAGKRLMLVITHNEGGSNKDLVKFTNQINSLCDKWDR